MTMQTLVFTMFCISNVVENRRHILQGGGGAGGGAGGYDSDTADDQDYVMDISITYDWQHHPLLKSYTIQYSYLWSGIKDLLDKSSHDLKQITDTTSNKINLVYHDGIFHRNQTSNHTFRITIELQTDTESGGNKLKTYVRGSLSNDIKSKFDNYYGLLHIYNVQCNIEAAQWDPTDLIIIGSIVGGFVCLILVGCLLNDIFGHKTKYETRRKVYVSNKKPNRYIVDRYNYNKDDLLISGYLRQFEDKNSLFMNISQGITTTINKLYPSHFIDGYYSGSYFQYGRSYPMKKFMLEFDDNNNIRGKGSDSVGNYNINGNYSNDLKTMKLNKTYIRGTGNYRENLGHTVTIKLEWHTLQNLFIGDWHVKTYKYEGRGKWIIKLCDDFYSRKKYKRNNKTRTKDKKKYHTINIYEV